MTLLSCSLQGLLPIPNANKYTQQAIYRKKLGSEIKTDIKKLSESKQIVGQKSWILSHLGTWSMQWRGKRQCCIAACIMNAAA